MTTNQNQPTQPRSDVICPTCGRIFNLHNRTDANLLADGHACSDD